jgi:hypothetical protein
MHIAGMLTNMLLFVSLGSGFHKQTQQKDLPFERVALSGEVSLLRCYLFNMTRKHRIEHFLSSIVGTNVHSDSSDVLEKKKGNYYTIFESTLKI